MDKVELSIPDPFINDFTVFYRGSDGLNEIKTSKDEFLRKLKYFQKQSYEIQNQNEIFIHENITFETFRNFLTSIQTRKIEIDKNNCFDLYELSKKYQYHDLEQQVDQFIKSRPDLKLCIDQLCTMSDDEDLDQYQETNFSSEKENIISENLDFCLKNSLLNKLPLPVLTRIVNSPLKKNY